MTDQTVYTVLTDQDKLNIVTQHIRNKEYAMYSDEIDYMEESSASVPSQATLDSITLRKTDNESKLTILQTEQTRLKAAIAAPTPTPTTTTTTTTGA